MDKKRGDNATQKLAFPQSYSAVCVCGQQILKFDLTIYFCVQLQGCGMRRLVLAEAWTLLFQNWIGTMTTGTLSDCMLQHLSSVFVSFEHSRSAHVPDTSRF